jgi:invasion protein IalB
MVRHMLGILATFYAFMSLAFAQGTPPVEQPSTSDRDSEIEKLVSDWNDLRNSADIDNLILIFHPDDRDTAAEFYANQRPAVVRVKVLSVREGSNGRLDIRIERTWGGSKPGRRVDTLQASAHDGQWLLRIPGGFLKPPTSKVTAAKETLATALVVDQHEAKLPLPRPSSRVALEQPEHNTPQGPSQVAPSIAPERPTQPPTAADTAVKMPQAGSTQASPPPLKDPLTKTFTNWTRICETQAVSYTTCFLQASLANFADKKPIMRWRVQILADKSALSAIVIPAGVTLPPGLTLGLSQEQPTNVPFRACSAQHCEVRFSMEPKLLESVSQRTDVSVKFVNQAGALVEFNVPMEGFLEAVNSILGGKSQAR